MKVGIGVVITKDKKILLGKRQGSHGAGTWGFPGGHLEDDESVEECACREVEEETGMKINDIERLSFTDDVFSADKRYITLYIKAGNISGEPQVMEPEKLEEWRWFSLHNFAG